MVDTRRTSRQMETGGTSQSRGRESTPIANAGDRPATPENVNTASPPHPAQQQAGNPGYAGIQGNVNDLFQMFTAMMAAVEQQRNRGVNDNRGPRTELEDNLKILEKFMKLNPPDYDGEPNVDKAEGWIEMMEKIFETMGCSERQMIIFATFKFHGAAEYWWRMVKDKWERAQIVWTWELFTREFRKHFIPGVVSEQREVAFLALEQNDLTIAQYEAKYSALARHNPHLIPNEAAKAKRYVGGLRDEYRTPLVALRLAEYSEAVERSYDIEHDLDRNRMKREQIQRQMGNNRQEQSSESRQTFGNRTQDRGNRSRLGNNRGNQSRREDSSRQQGTQSMSISMGTCEFCGKRSHVGAECWKKLGKCLGCGASDHRVVECPKWKGLATSMQSANQATTGTKRSSEGRPKITGRVFCLNQQEALDSTNMNGGNFNNACT